MKKSYETPIVEVIALKNEDIITTSGLINGGANGTSEKESFSSLFK